MDARARRLACAIALVSMAALAYQLLLVRWLAIAHWHPLAVVIISLALLGHGASGSALAVAGGRAVRRFDVLFPCCALAFAATMTGAAWLARTIPFNGLALAWDPAQLAWLSALYLCLALPFFFAASCFGLAFARFGGDIPRLYGADLLGAGAGAVLALLLLGAWPVDAAMAVVAVAAASAAPCVVAGGRARATAVVAVALIAVVAARYPPTPPVNEYKALAKTLRLPDARIVATHDSPYGWIAVVESPRIPLRHAPGLSLSNTQEPAPQRGVFVDGDAAGVVTRTRTPEALGYLRAMTSALPYALRPRARVAVLGAGTGGDVLQALASDARHVEAVERDPALIALADDVLRDRRVHVHAADPRAFLRANRDRFDIVVLATSGSAAAGSAGVQAVAEDFATTVEALGQAYARLAPGGLLAITRWDKQPPRDLLKLVGNATLALRDAGVERPGDALVVIRNWDAWTLLLKRGAFTAHEIARVRAFADTHGFDRVHHRGLRASEANQFHRVPRDDAYLGTRALLSMASAAYVRDYKFDIAPTHDDRPYFGNFFRWRTLPELWSLRAQGAAVLLDSGYLLLVAALAQAVPVAALLVLLPLLALPRKPAAQGFVRWRAAAYFVALGLGFLLIEIACLARLQLLVGHPLLALGVGLGVFLACAGLGSLFAQRWLARARAPIPAMAWGAVLAIAFGLGWHLLAFEVALATTATWPPWLRAIAAVPTIAPLAFAMGLPFPLGMTRLAREAPAFVPWGWGLNGCASVLAAIAALLLALEAGLVATLAIALLLYVAGALAWRGSPARQ